MRINVIINALISWIHSVCGSSLLSLLQRKIHTGTHALTDTHMCAHTHTYTQGLCLVIPPFRGINVFISLVLTNRFIYSIYYLSKDYHCCLKLVMYNVYHDLGPHTHTQHTQFGMELVSDNKQACNNCPKVTLFFFNPEEHCKPILSLLNKIVY